MKTIKREFVSLSEGQSSGYNLHDSSAVISYEWVASIQGPLSTGENIFIERKGKTAQEAYRALEFALHEQDWEIVK